MSFHISREKSLPSSINNDIIKANRQFTFLFLTLAALCVLKQQLRSSVSPFECHQCDKHLFRLPRSLRIFSSPLFRIFCAAFFWYQKEVLNRFPWINSRLFSCYYSRAKVPFQHKFNIARHTAKHFD